MPPLRTLLLLLTLTPALAQLPDPEAAPERQRRSQEAADTRKLVQEHETGIGGVSDATSLLNATPLEAQLRLNRVAREVAIRRLLRDALAGKGEPLSDPAATQDVVALRQHRAGEKMLSEQDLAAAHARLRQYAENTPQAKTYLEEVTRLEQLVASERLTAAATPRADGSTPSESITPSPIPTPEQEASRLQGVLETVAARRTLRMQAVGEKPATPAELEAARAVLRSRGEIYPKIPLPSAEERERQKQAVAKEVIIRRVIREAIAGISEAPSDPEVTKAIALLRAETSGKKTATPAELKAAHATLRTYAAQIQPEPTTSNPLMQHADRLEQVAAETSIRQVMHEALKDASSPPSDPEAAKAAGLIRAHELGEKSADPDALAAAYLTLRKYAEKAPADDLIPHEELMAMAERRRKLAEELGAKLQRPEPDRTLTSINDPQAKADRLERVAAEVARRRDLRNQAATSPGAAVTSPKKSGNQPETTKTATGPRTFLMRFPDTDMKTVAEMCKRYHPALTVSVADGVKARTVRLVIDADSEEELKRKFLSELRRQGIALVSGPDDSLVIDAVP